MKKKGCKFCSDEIKGHGVLYEDRFCLVILSKYPVTYGHTLVIPKEHFKDMLAADNKTISDMFVIAKKMATKMKRVLKPTGIKLVTNMAGAEEVEHMHVHLIPMYHKYHNVVPFFYKNQKIKTNNKKKLIEMLELKKKK